MDACSHGQPSSIEASRSIPGVWVPFLIHTEVFYG